MASKRQRGEHWEYTFKKVGVLPRPLYLTFKTEEEGDAYAAKLEQLLERGIVPSEHAEAERVLTLEQFLRKYLRETHASSKDASALNTVISTKGKTLLTSINVDWVDAWISEMKRVEKLAPSTIRAKVGAMGRATDWGVRKKLFVLPDHPFRTLPDGYAQYTADDTAKAGVERKDIERDRRLEEGEHERILAVIASGVLPRKQRPRPIEYQPAARFLYMLALESAMRLREMFTLTIDQVDVRRRTVFLDKTKNGDKRQVPMSSVAVEEFKAYMAVRALPEGAPDNVVFPWWNGSMNADHLHDVTDFLSKLYHCNRSPGIFDAAGCVGLNFHDLRHEATSRLFERTTLSETEIMKITGHKSHRMMMRYANLRGSNLADKLW